MWPKIKLIQTFTGVLVTCKNEEDPFKNEGARSPIVSLCRFLYDAQGKFTLQSEIGYTLNQTHPSFYGCIVTC